MTSFHIKKYKRIYKDFELISECSKVSGHKVVAQNSIELLSSSNKEKENEVFKTARSQERI